MSGRIDMKALNQARLKRQAVTKRTIQIAKDLSVTVAEKRGLGVGSILWDASFVLSAYIHNLHQSDSKWLSGRKTLELGSGVGLVGVCAAMIGAKVTLTDRGKVLSLAHTTSKLNVTPHPLRVAELDWGADPPPTPPHGSLKGGGGEEGTKISPLKKEETFSLILGADILYVPLPAIKQLVVELDRRSNPDTDIILAYKPRYYHEADFFKIAKSRGFSVEFKVGQEPTADDSRAGRFGNPRGAKEGNGNAEGGGNCHVCMLKKLKKTFVAKTNDNR